MAYHSSLDIKILLHASELLGGRRLKEGKGVYVCLFPAIVK